jgi:tetratricopeptide (TPR) repeat protein
MLNQPCSASPVTRWRAASQLTVLATLLVGCGRYAASHIERGDRYFEQQLYREAIAEYRRAVRVAPDHPRGIRQLGLAHHQLGERREAYNYLEKAVKLEPNDREARLALGSMYLDDRRPADAIKQAEAVLTKEPANLEALNLLGSGRLITGEHEKAIAAFRSIIAAAPLDRRGPYLLGLAFTAQGKQGEAIQAFEAALALDSAFADPLIRLVELDRSAARLDQALARVKRQIGAAGDSPRLENLLGVVHLARGETEAAERAFLEAIKLEPRFSDAYVRLAELYRSTGRREQALATANAALKVDSTNLSALMVVGYTYQQQGDFALARQAYEKALVVNPAYAPAANNLAWIFAEQGINPERALALAELAKRESPNDPHIGDTLGWVLYRLGEYRKAVSVLTESAAKLPDDPGVWYHLGMALGGAGDSAAARQALSRALSSKASFPEREAASKALAALK